MPLGIVSVSQSNRFVFSVALACSLLITHLALAAPPKADITRYGARPIPLADVRFTGGPLKHAQDLDAAYLLRLEPDRMLAFYRRRAGLEAKAAPYGGWDGDGRNLTGHIAGHYLSAVSLMWAATGDERFKERADYVVHELKVVQEAHGDGYLSALEGGRECFEALARGEIRASAFDLNGLWAPWYTLHKTFAGLRDAYRYAGNRVALDVEIRFAEWAESVLRRLSEDQIQRMLVTEFGGMNEVLVDLYADTGDQRWLNLSYRFQDRSLLEPLMHHQDVLPGRHGNTQVPKLIGSADRFAYAGDPGDLLAAAFFWDRVVHHHSFATGGHGKDEYFGPPDQLSDRIDGRTAETCNVYNMLKLTRRLFAIRPDAHYAEFHERALFNHILASIDPQDGRTCYMVPVGRAVRREYADMDRSFTCCVGTGMESHALHGDGIYYAARDRMWVNIYTPSRVRWEEAGVTLVTETDFPEGEYVKLQVDVDQPRQFTLALRRPRWAGEGFSISVNGEDVGELPDPASYVELKREWTKGDIVEVRLPKALYLEPLADRPHRAAIMWGPLVLAGDLGPEEGDHLERDPLTGLWQVPVLVAADRPPSEWIERVSDDQPHFRTAGVGREQDVDLVPFYRLHRRRYAVYWDLYTPEEYQRRQALVEQRLQQQREIEAITIAYVQPGDRATEKEFRFRSGEGTQVVRVAGRRGRRSRSWFSYDLPVSEDEPVDMIVTYNHDEWQRRTFKILIDDRRLADETIERRGPLLFYDQRYMIPVQLTKGKSTITVRFEATGGNETGSVFGVRLVRRSDDDVSESR